MKIRCPELKYQILPHFPLGPHYPSVKWRYQLPVTINLSSENCLKLLGPFKLGSPQGGMQATSLSDCRELASLSIHAVQLGHTCCSLSCSFSAGLISHSNDLLGKTYMTIFLSWSQCLIYSQYLRGEHPKDWDYWHWCYTIRFLFFWRKVNKIFYTY